MSDKENDTQNEREYPWKNRTIRRAYRSGNDVDADSVYTDKLNKHIDEYNEEHGTKIPHQKNVLSNGINKDEVPDEVLSKFSAETFSSSPALDVQDEMIRERAEAITKKGGLFSFLRKHDLDDIQDVDMFSEDSPMHDMATAKLEALTEQSYNKALAQRAEGPTIDFNGSEVENPLYGLSDEELRSMAEEDAKRHMDMPSIKENLVENFVSVYGSETGYDFYMEEAELEKQEALLEREILEKHGVEGLREARKVAAQAEKDAPSVDSRATRKVIDEEIMDKRGYDKEGFERNGRKNPDGYALPKHPNLDRTVDEVNGSKARTSALEKYLEDNAPKVENENTVTPDGGQQPEQEPENQPEREPINDGNKVQPLNIPAEDTNGSQQNSSSGEYGQSTISAASSYDGDTPFAKSAGSISKGFNVASGAVATEGRTVQLGNENNVSAEHVDSAPTKAPGLGG